MSDAAPTGLSGFVQALGQLVPARRAITEGMVHAARVSIIHASHNTWFPSYRQVEEMIEAALSQAAS